MKEEDKKEKVKAEEEKEEVAEAAEEEESVVESLEKELEEEEKEPLEEEKAETEEKAPEAEKPKRKKKEEEEEEIVEERTYTVPLSKAWIMPANKRVPRAVRILRSFMIKHMKLKTQKPEEGEEEEEPSSLIISEEVNRKMWARGIEKPPRNIRVRAAKDKDGNVTVYLAEGD
jgi:large subunit ribosomal protein L31e